VQDLVEVITMGLRERSQSYWLSSNHSFWRFNLVPLTIILQQSHHQWLLVAAWPSSYLNRAGNPPTWIIVYHRKRFIMKTTLLHPDACITNISCTKPAWCRSKTHRLIFSESIIASNLFLRKYRIWVVLKKKAFVVIIHHDHERPTGEALDGMKFSVQSHSPRGIRELWNSE